MQYKDLDKAVCIWTIMIECLILLKWTFELPHTLIVGALLTVLLFLFYFANEFSFSFREYCLYIKEYIIGNKDYSFYTVILLGILVGMSGVIVKDLSYIALGGVIACFCPLLAINIARHGTKKYFYSVAVGTKIVFVIFAIMSVIFVPLSYTQYSSFIGNPNEMTNFLVLVVATSLYLYDLTKRKRELVFLGMSLSFIIFSISRTAYVSTIALLLITVIYSIIVYDLKKTMLDVLKGISMFILVFVLIFTLLTTGNQTIRDIEKKITGDEYIFYSKLYKYDGSELNMGNLKDYIELRLFKGTGIAINEANGENEDIVNINEMSSGRLEIWKEFIKEFNYKGHKTGELVYVNAVKQTGADAHNTYINNGYYHGIIAMIITALYSMLLVYRYLIGLIGLCRERIKNSEFLFSSMVFVLYIIYSMLSNVFSPYHSIIAFAFWFICLSRIEIEETNFLTEDSKSKY